MKSVKQIICCCAALSLLVAGCTTRKVGHSHGGMETCDTRIGQLVFKNGYPDHETLEKLYDERDFQRACQAYLWSLPAISMMDFVISFQEDLGARFGDLIHIEGYDDASYGITANATTEYMIGFHDLSLSGPIVISEPVGAMAGFVNDMWQRPVTDLGIPGKFGGKGGKQLIVGPGQEVPQGLSGYNVVRSKSNYILYLTRILETDPELKAKVLNGFQIYPYSDRLSPKKTRIVPVAGRPWRSNQPRGMTYWQRLSEFINHEPVEERDRFYMATLIPLGIEKGKPFKPNARQKRILEEAVFVGEAMAGANNFHSRFPDAFYADGTKWDLALAHNLDQRAEHHNQLDERAAWYYEALTTSEGMTSSRPGIGSTYLGGYRDKDDDWLDGGRYYTLRVPANVPAKRFWSVTVYHNDTRYLIQNKQKIADRSSRMDLIKNEDGSITIYFGPKPPKGKEKNWIPTNPGEGWFSYFRLYGPLEAYFDRSWKLPDFEKVK